MCPTTYPVHIPQLQFAIDYPPVTADELDELTLSSGDIHSGHADFWNAWDQDKLDNEVDRVHQHESRLQRVSELMQHEPLVTTHPGRVTSGRRR